MKKLIFLLAMLSVFLVSCASKKNQTTKDNSVVKAGDTIRIANDKIEYEIIIIEPGFHSWFASTAKPKNFYSQSYLEAKNIFWVQEYNNRVRQPNRYDPSLYEQQIDYQSGIDYGLDVNYQLYNYFLFFQQQYRQKL